MTKDLAASVRARLLNIAKPEGSNFNQVLVRHALERFLYRSSLPTFSAESKTYDVPSGIRYAAGPCA